MNTHAILATLLLTSVLVLNCSGGTGNDGDTTDSVAADVAIGDHIVPDIFVDDDIAEEDLLADDVELQEDLADKEDVAPGIDLVANDTESGPDASPAEEVLADFEDLTLEADSFWDGSDGSGFFASGSLSFLNLYNQEYMSWDGYSYSNMTDVTTPGYDNQHSAIPGAGAEGSANYAVAHDASGYGAQAPTFLLEDTFDGRLLTGAFVTNATYTYLSMLEGDDFAKQFGGTDGSDPDWFLVTFTGYDGKGNETGTVEFYLADFRADEAADDYLVNEWTWVDFTALGEVEEVRAVLTSSDIGDWGMNTPAYFAIDQIVAAWQ